MAAAWLAEAFLKTTGGDPKALRPLLDSFVDTTEEELGAIGLPVLVLAGEEDDDNGSAEALAALLPSPGDTPVTASQSRRLTTWNFGGRFNRLQGRHTIRGGVDLQHFPLREHFTFAITDPAFNAPDSEEFNPSLVPFDLTRGGSHFSFGDKGSGTLYSAFLQDQIKLGRFQVALGMRYDYYRFLVSGGQWQPRVGFSYHLKETGTVLRASYNRTYQTPPNENLLMSSSEASAVLAPPTVTEGLGSAVRLIRPERQNVYEAGLQQSLGKIAFSTPPTITRTPPISRTTTTSSTRASSSRLRSRVPV